MNYKEELIEELKTELKGLKEMKDYIPLNKKQKERIIEIEKLINK